MVMNKLFKGSKNPPFDKKIFLKAKKLGWGIGEAYKHNGKVFFDFVCLENLLFGEDKESFVEWVELPN
jgi:hypothetical protein